MLRYDLDLTGSKFGCGEGACGACTVLIDNQAARSCVTRLSAVAGKAVTTIEGLGGQQLHPVQQAFLDAEAFQCGYCTPGMVMATVSLLRTTPAPSEADIARVMDRSVCRCGTYPRIVRAVKLAGTTQLRGETEGMPEGFGRAPRSESPHARTTARRLRAPRADRRPATPRGCCQTAYAPKIEVLP